MTVTTAATPASAVGTYAITAAGQTSSNYAITYAPGTLTVTKAPLTITPANETKVYGAALPTLTGTITGIKNGDDITASYATTATASSPVGGYLITATPLDPDTKLGNYTVTNNTGTLTVTQAALVVTPANKSRLYGEANPALTGTLTGVVAGDGITASYSTTAVATSPVGDYLITATLNDPDTKLANYSVTTNTGTLTITKAPLTVTVDSQNKNYGDANPALTGTITGIKNSDPITASYSTTATVTSSIGSYPITATLNDPSTKLGNYTVTNTAGTLVISQAQLIVTADNASRPYGDANPALGGTLTGVRNGDDITATYATAATPASPVSTYAIIPTLHGDTSNYTTQVNNGTLTITKAPLTITPANKTKVYGDANPTLTGTITGIKNADDITATYDTTATTSSPVGGYPITATLADPDTKLGNYTVTKNTATLTVTKAPLTITADNKSRTYGEANPTLTGTITGIKNSDAITATYATAATAATGVGTYTIVPTAVDSSPATLANYDLTPAYGTLTITKAPLSITAADKTKVYGSANPTLTGTITGTQNGDAITATYATTATAASNVGTYTIVPTAVDSTPATLANYQVTLVNGSLTITKAPLTITADDKTRTYGDANP
ncbi:MBG domain-containing protein, partial [Terrabacter sp. Root181]|uniref:MBG domain-containing protein n=1 Tax=Terrabacter sp. Root181 TaxID=1736484 RepID=UPI00210151EB